MEDGTEGSCDMPTITRSAIEWMQDQSEAKDARIDDLEEELELALEENAAIKLEITRLMSDRSLRD